MNTNDKRIFDLRFCISLTSDLHKRGKVAARAKGMSFAEFIRSAVRDAITQSEKGAANE